MRSHYRQAWVLLIAVVGVACYKPNIQDGGLICADGGKACPEGFQCQSDGRCHSGPLPQCQASSPHVDALCPAQPGDPCDPICQTGCNCGRCNLVGRALMCVPPGIKTTGDICNAAADDCSPGNICLKDCGGQVSRCYRFCANGSASDDTACKGQACDITVDDAVDGGATNLTVCEPPVRSCNPVADSGDCGSSALGCYITSTGQTACDCKGTAQPGAVCGVYNSCIAGYRCIQIGAAKCFQTCTIGGPDMCPSPQICKIAPGSPTYGYCDTP